MVLDNLALPNGLNIDYDYDVFARMTNTVLLNGSTPLNRHGYLYNEAWQRTNQTRLLGDYVRYTYDARGQLKTV